MGKTAIFHMDEVCFFNPISSVLPIWKALPGNKALYRRTYKSSDETISTYIENP